ncbi:hypothetical protein BRARA_D01325 [Brassica rapa]|uniref:RPW8 domain-containing protein n=1 Tax=Brassica campestris TaxID=3711 RepID=A0A397ZLC5_BRACM|nr:hypothetical protein BRARA_D01325 [Brassica rapa]
MIIGNRSVRLFVFVRHTQCDFLEIAMQERTKVEEEIMDTSLLPVSELLKLFISEFKKLRDFKDLFETLASTTQRIAPIIAQMEKVQKVLDPANKELDVLSKTMRRAIELVRECPRGITDKRRYTKEIKLINQSIHTFCQWDIPLLERRDSLFRRLEETQRTLFDEEEQRVYLESFKDHVKGKQVQVDQQFAEALHDSLINMKDLSLHQVNDSATQEALLLSHQEGQAAKRRARELLDEQIAFGLRYTETKKITNGSSSSTTAPLYKDERLDQMNDSATQEAILLSHQEEQASKRRARELLDEQIAFGLRYDEDGY